MHGSTAQYHRGFGHLQCRETVQNFMPKRLGGLHRAVAVRQKREWHQWLLLQHQLVIECLFPNFISLEFPPYGLRCRIFCSYAPLQGNSTAAYFYEETVVGGVILVISSYGCSCPQMLVMRVAFEREPCHLYQTYR